MVKDQAPHHHTTPTMLDLCCDDRSYSFRTWSVRLMRFPRKRIFVERRSAPFDLLLRSEDLRLKNNKLSDSAAAMRSTRTISAKNTDLSICSLYFIQVSKCSCWSFPINLFLIVGSQTLTWTESSKSPPSASRTSWCTWTHFGWLFLIASSICFFGVSQCVSGWNMSKTLLLAAF